MTIEDSIKIVEEVQEHIDWIEAGTTIILVEGLRLVKELKRRFPPKPVVADLKVIPGGKYVVEKTFEAGADIVVAEAFASNSTIKNAIEVAKGYNKKIMVDLLSGREKVVERAEEVEKLGTDLVGLHSESIDRNREVFLRELKEISMAVKAPIAIAGGINLKNIDVLLKLKPSVVIVGGAICRAKDPALAAKTFKEKMRAAEE